MSNTLVRSTPFLINESYESSKMHANAYKYIQSTDNDSLAQFQEQIFIGTRALEQIETCPKCKNELYKKVKSDRNLTTPEEVELAKLNGTDISTT